MCVSDHSYEVYVNYCMQVATVTDIEDSFIFVF